MPFLVSYMSSKQIEENYGRICSSCFNVLLIFDFCLECDVSRVVCSCKESFPSFSDFKDHIRTHDEGNMEVINVEIESKQATQIRQIFVCSFCTALFLEHKGATIHLKSIHTNLKKYSCAHCERQYETKISLRRHVQIHSQEPTYLCDICKKRYFLLAHLKSHILSHMNDKSFKCDLCYKSFNDNYRLRRHVKQHTGEKLFQCDQCDKGFRFHFTLKRHMLTHSRSESFICDVCNNTYKWKSDLKRHILEHTQGKSFACATCQKKFARKAYLLEHELSHSAAKLHLCFCGKTYKFLSGLSKHRKAHNAIEKKKT